MGGGNVWSILSGQAIKISGNSVFGTSNIIISGNVESSGDD